MRTHRFLAGAAAALLILGACGGSDDDAGGDDAGATVEAGDEIDSNAADSGETESNDAESSDTGSSDAGNADNAAASDSGLAPADVCSLFAPTDAEAAVGTELELAAEQLDDSCLYSAVDPTTMAFVNVVYTPGALTPDATLEQIAAMVLGYGNPEEAEAEFETVGSIDGALAMDVFGVPTVLVPHGNAMITVSAMGGDRSSAIGLAEVVADNL